MSAALGLERKDASHFQPLSPSVSQPHISESRRTRGEECVANLKHTVLPAARSPSWKGPRLKSHSTATFSFSSPPVSHLCLLKALKQSERSPLMHVKLVGYGTEPGRRDGRERRGGEK